MDKLPDYLIENYIIPYLSSYDLFYKFRSLSPYYYYCARNKILTHFPGEMMKTLKKIIDFNTKEDLTQNFDLITRKTFNEKRVLMLLMIQLNISLVIKKILETTTDERVIELISFLYVITKNHEKYTLIEQRNFKEIEALSGTEEGIIEMRQKISNVLEEDDLDFDLNEYIDVYESLDREFLLSNNYTGALYNYLRLLIDYCATKIKFSEIKQKLELFFQQITEASEIWPKRRVFYEKSIDLIADTQILSPGEKRMLKLMKKYDIENELTDFVYNKEKINNFSDPNEFEIIKHNRKQLNLAILRIHQMHYFFLKCIEYIGKKDNEEFDIEKNKIIFNVAGIFFEPGEFLYILSMIQRKFPFNEKTFFITKNFLHYNIIHEIYNIDESYKSEEIVENNKNEKEGNLCNCCNSIINFINDKKNKIYNYENQIDSEHLQGGIHDLQNVLENTKLAGKEINESFQKFNENLTNLNNSLENIN